MTLCFRCGDVEGRLSEGRPVVDASMVFSVDVQCFYFGTKVCGAVFQWACTASIHYQQHHYSCCRPSMSSAMPLEQSCAAACDSCSESWASCLSFARCIGRDDCVGRIGRFSEQGAAKYLRFALLSMRQRQMRLCCALNNNKKQSTCRANLEESRASIFLAQSSFQFFVGVKLAPRLP